MLAVCDFVNERYGKKIVECKISDSYYNMKQCILPHMEIVERAKAAMEKAGMQPREVPIRGGTDGARLSFEGLPCPNLSTGGYNFHGKKEFIPAFALDKMTEVILKLIEIYSE